MQDVKYTVVDDWNYQYIHSLKTNRVDAIADYLYSRQWMLIRDYPSLKGYDNLKDDKGRIPESKFRTLTGLRQDFWSKAKAATGAKTIEVFLTWNP